MQQVTREMGCSIEDLVRWFPLAMGDLHSLANLKIDGNPLFLVNDPLIEVVGFSKPARKIALLHIPVLELKIIFDKSLTPSQCEKAIQRFDLYTRRGGG